MKAPKIPNGENEESACCKDIVNKNDIVMYEDETGYEFYEIVADYCKVETKFDFELENIKNEKDTFVVSGETMDKMLDGKFKKVALDKENILG